MKHFLLLGAHCHYFLEAVWIIRTYFRSVCEWLTRQVANENVGLSVYGFMYMTDRARSQWECRDECFRVHVRVTAAACCRSTLDMRKDISRCSFIWPFSVLSRSVHVYRILLVIKQSCKFSLRSLHWSGAPYIWYINSFMRQSKSLLRLTSWVPTPLQLKWQLLHRTIEFYWLLPRCTFRTRCITR